MCIILPDGGRVEFLNGNPIFFADGDYKFALAIVEGKPIFANDRIFDKQNNIYGIAISMGEPNNIQNKYELAVKFDFGTVTVKTSRLSWNKPEKIYKHCHRFHMQNNCCFDECKYSKGCPRWEEYQDIKNKTREKIETEKKKADITEFLKGLAEIGIIKLEISKDGNLFATLDRPIQKITFDLKIS